MDYVLREKLMEYEGDVLRLTARGVDEKNGVHALFHAPSIQAYLRSRDPLASVDMKRHRLRATQLADTAHG